MSLMIRLHVYRHTLLQAGEYLHVAVVSKEERKASLWCYNRLE